MADFGDKEDLVSRIKARIAQDMAADGDKDVLMSRIQKRIMHVI